MNILYLSTKSSNPLWSKSSDISPSPSDPTHFSTPSFASNELPILESILNEIKPQSDNDFQSKDPQPKDPPSPSPSSPHDPHHRWSLIPVLNGWKSEPWTCQCESYTYLIPDANLNSNHSQTSTSTNTTLIALTFSTQPHILFIQQQDKIRSSISSESKSTPIILACDLSLLSLFQLHKSIHRRECKLILRGLRHIMGDLIAYQAILHRIESNSVGGTLGHFLHLESTLEAHDENCLNQIIAIPNIGKDSPSSTQSLLFSPSIKDHNPYQTLINEATYKKGFTTRKGGTHDGQAGKDFSDNHQARPSASQLQQLHHKFTQEIKECTAGASIAAEDSSRGSGQLGRHTGMQDIDDWDDERIKKQRMIVYHYVKMFQEMGYLR